MEPLTYQLHQKKKNRTYLDLIELMKLLHEKKIANSHEKSEQTSGKAREATMAVRVAAN